MSLQSPENKSTKSDVEGEEEEEGLLSLGRSGETLN